MQTYYKLQDWTFNRIISVIMLTNCQSLNADASTSADNSKYSSSINPRNRIQRIRLIHWMASTPPRAEPNGPVPYFLIITGVRNNKLKWYWASNPCSEEPSLWSPTLFGAATPCTALNDSGSGRCTSRDIFYMGLDAGSPGEF